MVGFERGLNKLLECEGGYQWLLALVATLCLWGGGPLPVNPCNVADVCYPPIQRCCILSVLCEMNTVSPLTAYRIAVLPCSFKRAINIIAQSAEKETHTHTLSLCVYLPHLVSHQSTPCFWPAGFLKFFLIENKNPFNSPSPPLTHLICPSGTLEVRETLPHPLPFSLILPTTTTTPGEY